MKQLIALMMIAFMLPAGAALAQGGPCQADKQKFCKDIMDAGGKPRACLKEHVDELSPACKEKLTKKDDSDDDGDKKADEKKASGDDASADKPADAKTDTPAASAPSTTDGATPGAQ